jgi:hypothetical protein
MHKFTLTFLMERQSDSPYFDRQHLSIIDAQSFKAEDFCTDHYLMVAKVRERLAVSKQWSH